jgi:Ca2+-binding RTX toxin-like protein
MAGIENLVGTRFQDQLTGSSGATSVDVISGEEGNDVIDGNGGAISFASYFLTDGPETVNLGAGTASGPDGSDTLVDITAVEGSQFPDSITGSDGDNIILGESGDDVLDGGLGTDSGDGGPGTDSCSNFETGPSGGTGPDNCEM